MDRDIKRFIFSVSRFVTTRFPFWEAFSTAMLLGEWNGRNRTHGIPDIVLYGHIGFAVLVGSLMSFDDRRKGKAALWAALQMAFDAFASLLIWSDSSEMVRLKIFARTVGIVGSYLHFASGHTHRRYVQIGNACIGFCLVAEAYLLYAWGHERAKLFRMLPPLRSAEDPVTFVLCVMLCLCAFCFFTASNLKPGAKCALALWSLVIIMNADYTYWTSYMELWTQFRIIAADILFALTLAITYAFN